MLSERIAALYALLQCNNTDIARHAGCSSGNISKLKSGNRAPGPKSRSVAVFAQGVYGYADYENLLDVLRELCGAPDSTRESVVPALVAWLYGTDNISLPTRRAAVPKSKRARTLLRQSFGRKLDRAMSALELSNGQLASLLSVDDSLVSRWRGGVYAPREDTPLAQRLSSVLLDRAEKTERTAALAALCGAGAAEIDAELLLRWFYEPGEEDGAALAQMLLRSLDAFTPGQALPPAASAPPRIEVSECYLGTDGLRSAVVRFLSDAAREGGRLLLYSDEPMDWMSGDREFFALWASLMMQCVQNGVHIRIIHNLDRSAREMAAAISGWVPLYSSGMIEPYAFRKEHNARFCHTVFLRAGGACIHGFFPAGAGERRRYDYLTDPENLRELEAEYNSMLSSASPFLKTYTAAMGSEFRACCLAQSGERDYLLTAPPVCTMPEELLARMLRRADIPEKRAAEALAVCRQLRERFRETLQNDRVRLLLCPPAEGAGCVNFPLELMDLSLSYTPEEYGEHIAAVRELVETERNFHLTSLPSASFRDIQLVTFRDAVAMLRCREPCAAFVFRNPMLTQSMSDYFDALIEQYAADRPTAARTLESWTHRARG